MSTAAQPLFDMSKAQPIAASPKPLFDMSKAQEIPSSVSGRQKGYSGLDDIVPIEGESFADTVKRAIAYGKTLTKADIEKQHSADLKVAPAVLTAAPLLGATGSAALTGAGEGAGALTSAGARLAAKQAITSSVGTGILDAAGNEIMRDVTTYGPSLLQQFGTKAVPWLIKGAIGYGGLKMAGPVIKHVLGLVGVRE